MKKMIILWIKRHFSEVKKIKNNGKNLKRTLRMLPRDLTPIRVLKDKKKSR